MNNFRTPARPFFAAGTSLPPQWTGHPRRSSAVCYNCIWARTGLPTQRRSGEIKILYFLVAIAFRRERVFRRSLVLLKIDISISRCRNCLSARTGLPTERGPSPCSPGGMLSRNCLSARTGLPTSGLMQDISLIEILMSQLPFGENGASDNPLLML